MAIIGAGNSAMDVARAALRKGSRNVTVFARGNRSLAAANEVEYTLLDGARIEYGKQIIEITDDGPLFGDTIFAKDGRDMGVGTDQTLFKADSIIVSVSQNPRNKLVLTTPGLLANEKGLLITDLTGQTTLPGIFAAGDVVHGAKTVVEAASWAKRVAQAMDEYLATSVGTAAV